MFDETVKFSKTDVISNCNFLKGRIIRFTPHCCDRTKERITTRARDLLERRKELETACDVKNVKTEIDGTHVILFIMCVKAIENGHFLFSSCTRRVARQTFLPYFQRTADRSSDAARNSKTDTDSS